MGRTDEAETAFREAAKRGQISGAVAPARLLVEQRGRRRGPGKRSVPYAEANETDEPLLVATVLEEPGDLEGPEVAYRKSAERGVGGPPSTSAGCWAGRAEPGMLKRRMRRQRSSKRPKGWRWARRLG